MLGIGIPKWESEILHEASTGGPNYLDMRPYLDIRVHQGVKIRSSCGAFGHPRAPQMTRKVCPMSQKLA